MAYSKRLATKATKQSKRLLNAALPCGYDAAMIEDDPARANHEHALAIERRIATATTRFDAAMTLKKEIDDRKDELLVEIVESYNDNLIKAHHHSDAAYVHSCWLEEVLVELYFPSLNLLDLDDVPDREAADDYLSHFEEDELEQAYEWSREQRRHDQLSLEYRGKLDRHDRRILEEWEGLRAREEPLEWDVENRRIELAQAKSARGDHSTELDPLQAAIVDGVPGLGGLRYGPDDTERASEEWWDQFNKWLEDKNQQHPDDMFGTNFDPEDEPVGISFDPESGGVSFNTNSSYEAQIEKMMAANDRELARVEQRALAMKREEEERDVHYEALVQENKLLRLQAADFDHRKTRKFIRVPGLLKRDGHPHFVNAVNALNELNRQTELIGEYFEVPLKRNAKGDDKHPAEMLALRHGIMHNGGPLRFKVKSRLDEDKNDIEVRLTDHKDATAFICILVDDVGSWSVATAKHEDRAWVHAENELFPGIKHRVGRFALAELVAKHHEIKEYYEANTKEVG